MLTRNLYPILLLSRGIYASIGECYAPGPAFPIPKIDASLFESYQLTKKFDNLISKILDSPSASWSPENTSFAIQLTSRRETLWSSYYTAPKLGNYSDGNPTHVSGDTAFRVASISKSFTVYGILLENGIGLDDSIRKYIPELNGETWGAPVDWEHVTIRSLASQLSGISRGNGNTDLATSKEDDWDPLSRGLPPIDDNDPYLKPCMKDMEDKTCTREEIIEIAKKSRPIFSPNDRSSYSNMAFTLLGLVLERATGKDYSGIIQETILEPLQMKNTTMKKPNDSWGVIPVGSNDWEKDVGPDNPSGGIYSTTTDLSKYLRSILNSELLPPSITNAWMKPHSWTSSGTNSAYGMPWEILRTTKATPDSHPLDIITKGGSLGGYFSIIVIIPEYGLGLTILTASPVQDAFFELRELVLAELIPSIDALVRDQAKQTYSGFYQNKGGHHVSILKEYSSISIEVDHDGPGLLLTSWKLNGIDFLSTYGKLRGMPEDFDKWQARLIPTNLVDYMFEESWRLTAILKEKRAGFPRGGLFNDYCMTDVDSLIYGGWSVEEFNFDWLPSGAVSGVELPGARTMLFKMESEHSALDNSDQDSMIQHVLETWTEHEVMR